MEEASVAGIHRVLNVLQKQLAIATSGKQNNINNTTILEHG